MHSVNSSIGPGPLILGAVRPIPPAITKLGRDPRFNTLTVWTITSCGLATGTLARSCDILTFLDGAFLSAAASRHWSEIRSLSLQVVRLAVHIAPMIFSLAKNCNLYGMMSRPSQDIPSLTQEAQVALACGKQWLTRIRSTARSNATVAPLAWITWDTIIHFDLEASGVVFVGCLFF